MALDVGHMKSLLTVQVFLENREYHLKIAPGDHLKTWRAWINLLESSESLLLETSENLEDLFSCQKDEVRY